MLDLKQIIQQQYQDKVNQVIELKKYSRPKEGWIRTVRKALGMSGSFAKELVAGSGQ